MVNPIFERIANNVLGVPDRPKDYRDEVVTHSHDDEDEEPDYKRLYGELFAAAKEAVALMQREIPWNAEARLRAAVLEVEKYQW